MSLSVLGARPHAAVQSTPLSPQREAFRDLGRALRSDDLQAAREAYKAIVAAAPEGASFPRDTPFADLGKSLVRGDMAAAKDAFRAMLREQRGGVPAPGPLPPVPALVTGALDLFA